MTEKEKMLAGKYYVSSDKELAQMRLKARQLVWKFNNLPPDEWEEADALLRQLIGKTPTRFFMEAPFHCDYGCNISLGENFYANFGCIMLDCAPITIGDNVMFGPSVSLYAVGHPLHHRVRGAMAEQALPISIGDNVWLGGGVIVNAGVSIGENTVIGSGSVVVKSIPANVLAAGNPCRVIRPITEEDLHKGELLLAEVGLSL